MQKAATYVAKFLKDFAEFSNFSYSYAKKKVLFSTVLFENNKNAVVKLFMMKRGRYSRPFLHVSVISVLIVGVAIGPFIASTYPVFSQGSTQNEIEQSTNQSIVVGEDVFQTDISQKPRDKTVAYTVQKGDTISTIARKFGVSTDTVKWENNLTGDNISIGDELKILSVTGISHKVATGDTVYSIAKRYDTDPQKIVDFPFNEFANPETFSLVVGQIILVPDGIKPSEVPSAPRRQFYIAQGPVAVSGGGFTWPLRGAISQFASWYHMAIDITSPVGTPIVAAQNGTVAQVDTGTWDGGYGNNVYIKGANGMGSHYAHMSSVNVSAGDSVVAGKTVVGWVGLSGRTTGAHLHFEITNGGALVNPLGYLQ